MRDARPWLLLDLAGVLLHFHPARRWHRLRELSGLDDAALRTRLTDSAISDRLDDGRATTDDLAAFLTDLARRPVDADEAWSVWLLPFAPDPRPIAALAGLGHRHRLGVFTNNAPAITRVFDAAPFERLFFSSELGLRKPDPESFRRVAELLDAPPDNILFIDDAASNIDAARAAGWRAALFCEGADLGTLVSSA